MLYLVEFRALETGALAEFLTMTIDIRVRVYGCKFRLRIRF